MKTYVNTACLGLLLVSLALSGCGDGDKGAGVAEKSAGASGGSIKYDSPEKAFLAFKAAATNSDLKKFMECMSAESQNDFAFGMVMMSAFLPMKHIDDEAKGEALAKEIESVMAKHGLSVENVEEMEPDIEPDYDKFFEPVQDKFALVADLFTIFEREDPDTPLEMLANALLSEMSIDGDEANAKMIVNGSEENIGFVKVDGGWLVSLPRPGAPSPGNQ